MAETNNNSNVLNVSYTAEEKLTRARIHLSRSHPFFGYLVNYMKLRDVEKQPYKCHIPTLAVTTGTTVMYNPKFIDGLTDNDVCLGVLAHEVMHLALKHSMRQGSRNIMLKFDEKVMIDGKEQIIPTYVSLYNIAADIVINNLLVQNSIKLPENGLIPSGDSFTIWGVTLKDITSQSAEEIYDTLAKSLEKQCEENKGKGKGKGEGVSVSVSFPGEDSAGDKNKNGDKPNTVYDMKGSPKGFDQHLWDEDGKKKGEGKEGEEGEGKGQDADGDSDEMGDVDWDAAVAEAAEHSKRQGKVPLGMEREFTVVKTKRINLDGYLRKIIGEMIPMDYTWNRPNKNLIHMGYYLPSTYGEKIKILFSIDTSGSVSNEDLSHYMGIISNIAKSHNTSVEFRLLTHDWEVHDDVHMYNGNMRKLNDIKIHGGGGTSHIPLFDYIFKKRYHKETRLLISFTDGYSSYPDKMPEGFKVVFVLAGSHCHVKDMPKWGISIPYAH